MVLIITHNEQFGRYLTEWLNNKGYPCSLACDGQQGLERARQDVPTVVVLDLYVKEPSGMDVLLQLREQKYTGKVILMGGVSLSRIIPEALRLGVDQVIGWESDLGPIECAIQSALESASTKPRPESIEEKEQSTKSAS